METRIVTPIATLPEVVSDLARLAQDAQNEAASVGRMAVGCGFRFDVGTLKDLWLAENVLRNAAAMVASLRTEHESRKI